MPITPRSDFKNYVLRLNPLMTKYRCAYNVSLNLRKPAHTIRAYYLISSGSRGTSVIEGFYYSHIRKPITPAKWAEHLRERGIAAFATRYLPNLNEHYGTDWVLTKLLCFVVQKREYHRASQKNVRLHKSKRLHSKRTPRNQTNSKRRY